MRVRLRVKIGSIEKELTQPLLSPLNGLETRVGVGAGRILGLNRISLVYRQSIVDDASPPLQGTPMIHQRKRIYDSSSSELSVRLGFINTGLDRKCR